MQTLKGDPDSPHAWLQPIGLEELKSLLDNVRYAAERGWGFTSITMNRIEIALNQLKDRMEDESSKV